MRLTQIIYLLYIMIAQKNNAQRFIIPQLKWENLNFLFNYCQSDTRTVVNHARRSKVDCLFKKISAIE